MVEEIGTVVPDVVGFQTVEIDIAAFEVREIYTAALEEGVYIADFGSVEPGTAPLEADNIEIAIVLGVEAEEIGTALASIVDQSAPDLEKYCAAVEFAYFAPKSYDKTHFETAASKDRVCFHRF